MPGLSQFSVMLALLQRSASAQLTEKAYTATARHYTARRRDESLKLFATEANRNNRMVALALLQSSSEVRRTNICKIVGSCLVIS
jgi:hypothetical protein